MNRKLYNFSRSIWNFFAQVSFSESIKIAWALRAKNFVFINESLSSKPMFKRKGSKAVTTIFEKRKYSYVNFIVEKTPVQLAAKQALGRPSILDMERLCRCVCPSYHNYMEWFTTELRVANLLERGQHTTPTQSRNAHRMFSLQRNKYNPSNCKNLRENSLSEIRQTTHWVSPVKHTICISYRRELYWCLADNAALHSLCPWWP